MRTTLDIDDDVLQAARERARLEGRTPGEVVSDLLRRALARPAEPAGEGWLTFPDREGVRVTSELVRRLLEEDDLADR